MADKSADGLGVIDAVAKKLLKKLSVGSDPEQFAISKDGTRAFISDEDRATASIVELEAGRVVATVKVSEEPEGVAVNPAEWAGMDNLRRRRQGICN